MRLKFVKLKRLTLIVCFGLSNRYRLIEKEVVIENSFIKNKYYLMKKNLLLLLLFSVAVGTYAQKNYELYSPDAKLKISINVSDEIQFSLSQDNDVMIDKSPISMSLSTGEVWGRNSKVRKTSTSKKEQTFASPFSKTATVEDKYNEMHIEFRDGWDLMFRAYDEGMAYRFVSHKKGSYKILNENASFIFPSDFKLYAPYIKNSYARKDPLQSSFENIYTYDHVSNLDPDSLMFLPILVEADNGKKICITEVDLESYPGMYLQKDGVNSLGSVFANYPLRKEQGGHNMLQQFVREREDYIANVSGQRSFPWRVAIVSTDDKDLTVSDLVYKLAESSRVEDISWIKPGKVAWDWWNNWNIYDVDFKAGINNDTYKYYIDFASKNGIEYVILDEGWAVNLEADLMQVIPEIDIPELIAYGKERNVDIILWAGYWAFDRDMEKVCKHYSEMGVKGFKVDFMNRDDQEMVDFIYRASETAARYKLVLNFHGMYKPTGLQRTFPNILNIEGVNGLEQLKWAPDTLDMVTYDVTIPFIRMVAGPMDYTQGAMRNAAKGNYEPINSEAMSQGTRCRQLALYVVFESPMNMLCDSPTEYMKEPQSLEFISQIPTTWDESIAINGKVSEYVTLARRKGTDWYIGGLTNWDARDMDIDLSFLPEGSYKITLFTDGLNAYKKGIDYQYKEYTINSSESLNLHLAPGGGFAVKLEKM